MRSLPEYAASTEIAAASGFPAASAAFTAASMLSPSSGLIESSFSASAMASAYLPFLTSPITFERWSMLFIFAPNPPPPD